MNKRRKILESSEQLEWAGRRMMEFRTAILLVNWLEEEGLLDRSLDPVEIAKRFTGGPSQRARKIFNQAKAAALNGLLHERTSPQPRQPRK